MAADGSLRNSLCEGFKMYFGHVAPYMDFMRDRLRNAQAPALVMEFARSRSAGQDKR